MMHRKITIGRSLDCDLVLADISVSRLHAMLELLSNNRLLLTDCQSTQGTFVVRGNTEERVQAKMLSRHDMLRFGNIRIPVSEILNATHLNEEELAPSVNVIQVADTNHINKVPEVSKEIENIDLPNRGFSNTNNVNCYINVEDEFKYQKFTQSPPPTSSSESNGFEWLIILLALFLFLSNPNKTDFGIFIDKQINQKLSEQVTPKNDSLTVVRGLLSNLTKEFILEYTEIHNYYLFSTYTIDASLINSFNPETPKILKFIGIANTFLPIDTQQNKNAS